MASALKRATLKSAAAFSALETVGLETITGLTFGALLMAPRWTRPIRPHPITPTLISLVEVFSSAAILIAEEDLVRGPTLVKAKAELEGTATKATKRVVNFILNYYTQVCCEDTHQRRNGK